MVAAGEFLEWADVFGNLYGTSAADTERLLDDGHDVVLVIDVQGARKVRRRGLETTADLRHAAVASRCSSSGCAGAARTARTPSSGGWRWRGTRSTAFVEYDYVVINDELTAAVERLRGIVLAERARLACMRAGSRKHCQDIS